MLLSLVCSEVNSVSVPRHTWWIDSGTTTHISVSLQGSLSCRKRTDGERYIYVRDGNTVEVQAIGKFRLSLKTEFYLDLNETYVVPSFKRNLISANFVFLFHLEMEFLVCFKIQSWLVLVLYS